MFTVRHLYFIKDARHLYFLKCSLLERKNCQLLVLAKINTLLACSQRPFDTPFIDLLCTRIQVLNYKSLPHFHMFNVLNVSPYTLFNENV